MKNFRLQTILFALAFITLFAACKKDDDQKPATVPQKVLGKWTIKKLAYKYSEDNQVLLDIEETGKVGDYLEFNSNKTYVSSIDRDLDSGTYEILNDNTMTITSDGEKSTITIDKLDNKEFNCTKSYSEIIDGTNVKEVFKFELSK